MPAARLTDEEQARVAKGECACGCGEKLPTVRQYDYRAGGYVNRPAEGRNYLEGPHRQRAYDRRRKEGRVLSSDARKAIKLREEAAALMRSAEHYEEQARALYASAVSCRQRAVKLREEADGQLTIPGIAPVRKGRGKGADTASSPAASVSDGPPYVITAGEGRDLARLGWSREERHDLTPAFRAEVIRRKRLRSAVGELARTPRGIYGAAAVAEDDRRRAAG